MKMLKKRKQHNFHIDFPKIAYMYIYIYLICFHFLQPFIYYLILKNNE
jgi:hypothetical protein